MLSDRLDSLLDWVIAAMFLALNPQFYAMTGVASVLVIMHAGLNFW